MASVYNGFHTFPFDFLSGQHDFESDVYHIILTNTEPDYANDVQYSDIVEIAAQNGYDAGGIPVTLTLTQVTEDSIVTAGIANFEADGGSFGPFQWAVLYNFSSPSNRLVAAWEYEGGSISLLDTETLTFVFGGPNGVFKVTQP